MHSDAKGGPQICCCVSIVTENIAIVRFCVSLKQQQRKQEQEDREEKEEEEKEKEEEEENKEEGSD